MADIDVILIKPLDGDPIGARRTLSEQDFNDLEAKGAVKVAPAKKSEGPDYERDGLKDIDLAKASKDQLMVIAAHEKADAADGDKVTVADLRKAIEAKRKGA